MGGSSGLPNSVPKPEVSDTTGGDSSTGVGEINAFPRCLYALLPRCLFTLFRLPVRAK